MIFYNLNKKIYFLKPEDWVKKYQSSVSKNQFLNKKIQRKVQAIQRASNILERLQKEQA